MDIQYIKGIGPARAEAFSRLGIYKLEDFISFYPSRYEDRTNIKFINELVHGETACIIAKPIKSSLEVKEIKRNFKIYKILLTDKTGQIVLVLFNQEYTMKNLDENAEYIFYGKISIDYGFCEINATIIEPFKKPVETMRIAPIYPLTHGINQKTVYNVVKTCLEKADICEYLPPDILSEYNLISLEDAISFIHNPKSFKQIEEAQKRLKFDELLLLQLGLSYIKRSNRSYFSYKYNENSLDGFKIPFELTNAQKNAIEDIRKDFMKDSPMNRLVQGDVGCGKTVIAAAAVYLTVLNGYQCAFMVPTEILARQHFETFTELFKDMKICLLIGSLTVKKKAEIKTGIQDGVYDLIIGTHAIIQEEVVFRNLSLVITDEQHRFGVKQRNILNEKGISNESTRPHFLVMSATPIPRTLAQILYGELDISIVNELPPGRTPVKTYVVKEDMRERINNFIKKEITNGRQVYIVCPLVEASETLDLKNVKDYTKKLQTEVFDNLNIALIHSKLKPKEKESIMSKFLNKEIDILVSTTVIEVGVNVKNASIMIIENAERFGLSQLHQLRGRVGRGEYESFCILFYEGGGEISKQRMKIMQSTSDGFVISEKDLELRGPGELFGTRQHGIPALKLANLSEDQDIIKMTRGAASNIINNGIENYDGVNNKMMKYIKYIF